MDPPKNCTLVSGTLFECDFLPILEEIDAVKAQLFRFLLLHQMGLPVLLFLFCPLVYFKK